MQKLTAASKEEGTGKRKKRQPFADTVQFAFRAKWGHRANVAVVLLFPLGEDTHLELFQDEKF